MGKFALAAFCAAAAILSARGHGTHSIKLFVGDTNQSIHDGGWVKTSTLGGLPFVDESASVIFAPNTLNNVSTTAVDQLLDEWYRVLQPGGVVRVCVLDFKALAKLYAADALSLAAFTDITTISGNSQTWYVGNPGQSYFTLSNFALSTVCSPIVKGLTKKVWQTVSNTLVLLASGHGILTMSPLCWKVSRIPRCGDISLCTDTKSPT